MIKSLSIENFKSLSKADFDFGAVNVLIGPNGTGKSSVLQFLSVLNQSWDHESLVTSGPSIDLLTYGDVVHGHDPNRLISFRIGMAGDYEPPPRHYRDATHLLYEATVDARKLQRHELTYFNPYGERVAFRDSNGQAHSSFSWSGDDQVSQNIQVAISPNSGLMVKYGQRIGLPLVFGGASYGNISRDEQASMLQLFDIPRRFSSYLVVPALRGFDATSYELESGPSADLFGAGTPGQQASRVLSTIAYHRDLEEEISRFSRRVLDVEFRTRLTQGRRVSAEALPSSGKGKQALSNLVNEGFGANQLILLLAQLVLSPHGAIVGLEEPEIHLHPLAQAHLAEILVEMALDQGKQLLLTSHSEHLLLGLLTCVAKEMLPKEALRVFYFTRSAGATRVEYLEADSRGRLKGGLKGFFEASIREMDDYLGTSAKHP